MAGPFQIIELDGGRTAPLYLLRYDEKGRLRSPQAEKEVKEQLASVTDVYLFAHGWNNVFAQALDRYNGFASGYIEQGTQFQIPAPENSKPLLVGVIWPSTSFVMPWEAGPDIAGPPDPDGREAAEQEEMLGLATESLSSQDDEAFVNAVDGQTSVDPVTARRLAEIVLNALRTGPDPDDASPPPDPDELLRAWSALRGGNAPPGPAAGTTFGTIGSGPSPGAPDSAALSFDPRGLLRIASVWKMKARAGAVGTHGVGPLVEHILRHSDVRLHLIGHSFGARVVLSALTASSAERKAHAMLLLQPAVNRWCFAPSIENTGRSGGYRTVPAKLERPLLTTFSAHDEPLTKFFHLAMRGSHLGEPQTAAVGNTHLYGALGGYGPAGLDGNCVERDAVVPGAARYLLDGGPARVVAVNGSVAVNGAPAIGGHSDISNPVTWWALHDLTRLD